jgi:hypothetical protein
MSTTQNLKLTRAVKVILDFIFWLLVIASIFLALYIAVSPLIFKVSDIPYSASVPVAIGIGDEPQFDVQVAGAAGKGINAAYVEGAQGTLRLETTNWYYFLVSNLAKLLTAIGLAYVLYLLRKVLGTILGGDPFATQNVTDIRRIGYLVLVVGFLRALFEYTAAWEILRQLTITNPPLSLPSPFNAEVILASLLILVLAQVWSYGYQLERDQALTV